MISGTASVDELAHGAAQIAAFGSEPIQLGGVTGVSLVAELRRPAREEVLPPALHPIVPPAMSLLAWDVSESPWGPFCAAFVRVVCRSGARARTYCVGAAASTTAATDGLRGELGFPAQHADVTLRRHYDEVDVKVTALDGSNGSDPMLAVSALDPDPLGLSDVQHVGSMNLAHTPLGLRLVQVETRHTPNRTERLAARIEAFDSAAWGQPLLDPYWTVSCSVSLEDIDIPPIRFVCDPAKSAAEGTERVQ